DHWQKRLQELAHEIAAARDNRDEYRVRLLAQEWQQGIAKLPLPQTDPRCEIVAPILRWLARVEKRDADANAHQQALAALQEGLRNPELGEAELEELFLTVADFKEGVPAALEDVYNRRINKMRNATQWWERLLLWGVIAITIALIGGMVYVLSRVR